MSLVLIPDGPGTTIVLRDGFQGLPSAPRGTGAIMGRFASGPVDHAALAVTPEAARLISGDPHDEFEASLALSDMYYYNSPPALLARVTDGNEVQAQAALVDRNPFRSYLHRTAGSDRGLMATVKAHNGGRWGGRRKVLVGKVAAIATDLMATQIDTGLTMLEDEWADARFYLEGDSTSPYTVEYNDTAGVLTIKGDFSQAAQDADGTGAIDGQWRLDLEHDEELAIVVGPDSEAGVEFAIKAERKFDGDGDWEVVTSYGNLGLSPNDSRPWVTEIYNGEEEGRRYQIALENAVTDATVPAKLPANFCEIPVDVTDATLEFQWYRWYYETATGDCYLDAIAPVDSSAIVPHTIKLTFTAPTTATVTIVWPDGSETTLPTALTLDTPYTVDHPQLCDFTINAGGTPMAISDVIYIEVSALPHDLYQREAFLYPVACQDDGDSNVRLRIVSNTYKTVTVRSDLDLAGDYNAVAAASPSFIGSVDITAYTWVVGETLIFDPDGTGDVTFTGTGEVGVAAILAALTAADTDNLFSFTQDAATGGLKVELAQSKGSKSQIDSGAGTANAGFGITDDTIYIGTDGVPARIEARWPMWGGYDGIEPASSQYQLALDLDDSLFKRWLMTNLGLVRVATPGVYATAVIQAADAFVAKQGWMYIAEFDPSLYALSAPGEGAVDNMTTNQSESDYVEHYFPSDLKFFNVARTKLVQRSAVGLFMGLKSWLANVGVDGEKGLHIAMANNNQQGKLSPRAQGLPDDLGRWSPPIGLMNDNGIVPILWEGPDIYAYGNRMYSKGRTRKGRRYTITERAVHYHVARDLFITTRPNIFKSISAKRLGEILKQLREKMKVYWQDGWFSDHAGPGFEDQCQIAVPLSLNPAEDLLEGLVTGTVQYRPRPALEDLKLIISPTEVSSEG